MKSTLLLLLILSLFACSVQAQNREGKNLLYYKELSFGFALNTQGWGIFSDYDKIKDARTRNLYEFEFGQLRNPKEYRQTQNFGYGGGFNQPTPKPFIFGKQNNFYPLNISVGRAKEIGRKADKSGVSISVKYLGGLSVGFLKPYYLDLLYLLDNNVYQIVPSRYSASTSDKYLDKNAIFGAAGFNYGLGETSIIPGAHGKLGLCFDWAAYDEFVKTIEVGIEVDAYYKKVPIMIEQKNQQVFPNLFLSVQFGKRW